ncbi:MULTISPECIES: DUF6090 family protein [Flavobacteriaceae]|uniref:DUF6090 family protein n=1 Tax=Flavobacteriaceae TaxID=49546 RepID=UPI0014908F44|nr:MULTISPECIES: DUF6090 family protein [Allomuricauda]MDC6367810.1 DUF6090 family protein [Muricauda sp. AC10]
MIKFFRKIRQKLLSENKFSKYLIYAVGEIVLVVIGILIALQINNWNEQRKIKKQETQVYKELKSDLLQTRYDILNVVSNNKAIVNSTTKLIEAISKKKPYNDSIYKHFSSIGEEHKIFPKTSAFENLKNIGLSTLSNDSLRIDITNLYQIDLIRLTNEIGGNNTFLKEKIFPYQIKYYHTDLNSQKKYSLGEKSDLLTLYEIKIKNYDQFLTDNELLLVIQLALFTRSVYVEEQSKTVETIDNLIDRIDKELGTKNK